MVSRIAGFAAGGAAAFVVLFAMAAGGETLNDALRSHRLKTSQALRVDRNVIRTSGGTTYQELEASNEGLYVKIEISSPVTHDRAMNYAKAQYAMIADLYGPQPIPYSGQITNQTECPKDRRPERLDVQILGIKTEVLVANGTERHTFGVWEDDLIKTKGAFGVVFDENEKSLLEFKVFQSSAGYRRENATGFFESLSRR